MKKMLSVILVCAICILLSSCSWIGISSSDNLHPPKPTGELYEIQKTLEKSVGKNPNLVYPSSGEYRSAIVTKDINSDGKYEVFAFYSTQTDDKTTVMHMNYIKWADDEWISVSDIQVNCSGVESVDFVRLDESKTPKILVNWSMFSSSKKSLSVYSIEEGCLKEVTSADYSVYSTYDFDGNGIFEIVAVYLDAEAKTSTATLLSLGEKGFAVNSSCKLDGGISSYYAPHISKFTNGTPAMFVDAVKGTGMITEILYIDQGQLKSAINYNQNMENTLTLRPSSVRATDFDGDGCIDIPLAEKVPTVYMASGDDAVYMTVWHSFNGTGLTPLSYSLINYIDGYFIVLPDEWKGTVAISRNKNHKERVFYRWDSELEEIGEEILKIQTVPAAVWDTSSEPTEYKELGRSADNVYTVKFSNSALNPGEDYFKKNFHVLKETYVENKNN